MPESLKEFNCSTNREDAKVKQLAEEFGSFKKEDGKYSGQDIKLWKEAQHARQQIQALQNQQSQFQDQETKINYLELRVQELIQLIKTQKEKIINTFLRLFPERDLLQELITVHLEYTKTKKQELPSIKLRKQRDKIRDELEEKISEELAEKIELVLNDCEDLVIWELELESKLNDKISLIENQKQVLQITNSNKELEKNIETQIVKHETIQQKEQNQLQEAVFKENYLQSQLSKVEELIGEQNSEQTTQIIQQQPFGFASSSKPK